MREIEFRAWDKENNEMFIPLGVSSEGEVLIDMGYDSPDYWGYDRCVIMQYTGLKDKNGKKIFEGDIIKNEYDETYLVVYEDANAAFIMYGKEEDYSLHLYEEQIPEVIGNIHDNKELLE